MKKFSSFKPVAIPRLKAPNVLPVAEGMVESGSCLSSVKLKRKRYFVQYLHCVPDFIS